LLSLLLSCLTMILDQLYIYIYLNIIVKQTNKIFLYCREDFYSLKNSAQLLIEEKASIIDAKILRSSINGILTYLYDFFPFLVQNEQQYFTRINNLFMAPSNISWGVNNGTTALPIPSIGDRRVKFRFPAASSNVICSVISLLFGAFTRI
jgi:hypothetical protein